MRIVKIGPRSHGVLFFVIENYVRKLLCYIIEYYGMIKYTIICESNYGVCWFRTPPYWMRGTKATLLLTVGHISIIIFSIIRLNIHEKCTLRRSELHFRRVLIYNKQRQHYVKSIVTRHTNTNILKYAIFSIVSLWQSNLAYCTSRLNWYFTVSDAIKYHKHPSWNNTIKI